MQKEMWRGGWDLRLCTGVVGSKWGGVLPESTRAEVIAVGRGKPGLWAPMYILYKGWTLDVRLLDTSGPGYVAAPVSWDSALRLRISFV